MYIWNTVCAGDQWYSFQKKANLLDCQKTFDFSNKVNFMKPEAMNHRSLVVTTQFVFEFIQQNLASLLGTSMFPRLFGPF